MIFHYLSVTIALYMLQLSMNLEIIKNDTLTF